EAAAGGEQVGEEVGGAAHVVGGEHLDDRVDVPALAGEAGDVRVVLGAAGDRGLEDRGVGGHADDVAGLDELLQVAGAHPLPGEVVEPDGHAGVGEGLGAGILGHGSSFRAPSALWRTAGVPVAGTGRRRGSGAGPV